MNAVSLAKRATNFLKNKLLFEIDETAAVWRGDAICAYWANRADTRTNFGDAINPIIIEYLTGRRAVHSDAVWYMGPWPTLYCIGSILDNLSQGRAVVAGSGFKRANSRIWRKPAKVIAVRGPLTRARFDSMGIACPSLFCDPGLIVSRVFGAGAFERKFDVGIIPHFIDRSVASELPVEAHGRSYNWIDIRSDPPQVISAIRACDRILSSSLHGIVTAHAYGIPAAWMRMSDSVGGDGFKFHDYYRSLGVTDPACYDAASGIDLADAEQFCLAFEVDRMVDDYIGAVRSQFPASP